MIETRVNFCEQKFCSREDGPSSREVSASLGGPLGKVVFDYSHTEARKLLGQHSAAIIPCNIDHPANEQLRGDANQPLMTKTECLKADVHKDILELGKELLEQYRIETQQKAVKNLQCHMEDVFHMYQAKKHEENDLNIRELHKHYENYIKAVQHELEEKLEREWKKVIASLHKKLEKCSNCERMRQRRESLQFMRSEIRYIITHLYGEFEQHFRALREQMIADFNEIMRRAHLKLGDAMRSTEEKHDQKMRIQRQELKMQNTADIMHLLCAERAQIGTKERALHKTFQTEISQLQKTISALNETVNTMSAELTQVKKEKEIVEGKFSKCSKEFKRLVCFVFHTVPDHAEYLLPLDNKIN